MRYGYGYGYGNGGDHWALLVVMAVVMVVFLGAVAWVVVTLLRRQGSASPPGHAPPFFAPPFFAPPGPPPVPGPPQMQGALTILNERFARGEIDEEEYARRRSLIERTE